MTLEKFTERQILSVSEITKNIKRILEIQYSDIWVKGEISGYKLHSSGHAYFNLKDDGAIISCAFFKNSLANLKFIPENGMEAIIQGRISVYEGRGSYQIIVNHLEPVGKGELQIAFEQMLIKLQEEGLFDAPKKPIPSLPQKIGVVTSSTGAAIRDIINILNRRSPGIEVYIFPSLVQGEGAAENIAKMIETANLFTELEVLIVGRGGGSQEDLWAFNEEIVARAIFNSELPIISAVGHEIDTSISDLVADLRAPTPSAAAELVSSQRDVLLEQILIYQKRCENKLQNLLNVIRERVNNLSEDRLNRCIQNHIEDKKIQIDDLEKDLENIFDKKLTQIKEKTKLLSEKLNLISPSGVLDRGYSILVDENGKVIKDTASIKVDDNIKALLSKGEIILKVVSINDKINNNVY